MTWLLSASELVNDEVLREQRVQRAALALQDLDQRRGQRVDILRVQALDDGFEPAEQQVEVERGRRAVHRICAPGGRIFVDPELSTSSR